MKYLYLSLFLFVMSCNNSTENTPPVITEDSIVNHPTLQDNDSSVVVPGQDTVVKSKENKDTTVSTFKRYGNARFKDVIVKKIGTNKYIVRGKGQIFEASFSWVVEDGHNEILEGHEMTDAGAPEWGKFHFTIDVKKVRANSTLTLILYESSAKDGSRQHQLPIPLS